MNWLRRGGVLIWMSVVSAHSPTELQKARIEPHNQASLQRGAKLYVNYCQGCHSLNYTRYSSVAQLIGLTDETGAIDKALLTTHLMFGDADVHAPMAIALSMADARAWFGVMPPDLTLVARVRGVNWLYTYLKSFYRDDERIWGVNNLLFPDVAMPNVLLPLQGEQVLIKPNAQESQVLLLTKAGQMSERQFDTAVRDLVNFLYVVAEPAKSDRLSLGGWVIGFILIIVGILYGLKREYWKYLSK